MKSNITQIIISATLLIFIAIAIVFGMKKPKEKELTTAEWVVNDMKTNTLDWKLTITAIDTNDTKVSYVVNPYDLTYPDRFPYYTDIVYENYKCNIKIVIANHSLIMTCPDTLNFDDKEQYNIQMAYENACDSLYSAREAGKRDSLLAIKTKKDKELVRKLCKQ